MYLILLFNIHIDTYLPRTRQVYLKYILTKKIFGFKPSGTKGTGNERLGNVNVINSKEGVLKENT